jgi:hypothetical protein
VRPRLVDKGKDVVAVSPDSDAGKTEATDLFGDQSLQLISVRRRTGHDNEQFRHVFRPTSDDLKVTDFQAAVFDISLYATAAGLPTKISINGLRGLDGREFTVISEPTND